MDTDPSQVPPESQFLLEFDTDALCQSHFETQQYWVAATQAAVKAGSRQASSGARAKRARANRIQ